MGPEYIGNIHPNCDYFHGQIPYAKGVHLYQVSRANREEPELDDGTGHTYKHAPDLCWYEGRYYIQYLTNPKDEHGGAGVSVLTSSADGRVWGDYQMSCPEYRIPACEVTDYKGLHHVFDGTKPAFMHQRMAFYQAQNGVMLVLGFYGWSPELWMTNWDNYGIGRVVRRLYPDGHLGEIYFIRVNWQAGWRKEQLLYPLYEESGDEQFKAACRELLGNPLAVQQWAEENGDRDPQIRIKHPDGGTYQAFCWYHRAEKDVVGLWKHSFVSESHDGGESWERPVKSPSLVMSGQKIWGAKTPDGRYALVYDPTLETQHRFPLCIVTSDDGLHFDNMFLIHGEVPPLRYEGFCKDLGPQYMRGISEGNPRPGGELCVTYSVNKEDIWFARIPVPVEGEERLPDENAQKVQKPQESQKLHEMRESMEKSQETQEPLGKVQEDGGDLALSCWNLYQPSWCRIERMPSGQILLEDREPYDYARLVRLFPTAKRVRVTLRLLILCLGDGKSLQIELGSAAHQTAVRILFRPGGRLRHRTVCELDLGKKPWRGDEELELTVEADCESFSYTATVRRRIASGGPAAGDGLLAGGGPAGDAEEEDSLAFGDSSRADAPDAVSSSAGCEDPSGWEMLTGEISAGRFPFMAAVGGLAELSLRTGEPRYLADLEQNPDGLPKTPMAKGRCKDGAKVFLYGVVIKCYE